ncbi:MAG: MFS transporter [Fimbriimonadaceae bacterium]|nr:MFS transporter [Fimbriimonadaceae bacterium]
MEGPSARVENPGLQSEPSRLDNLRTLRMANLDVGFATAFGTLVTGTFLVGFIKFLGGSDIWIGLLAAVPSLLGILQIPGGIWGRGFPSYKPFVLVGSSIWRALYVPLIVLPFLPLDNQLKLWILATCIGTASAAVLIVSPIYNDWLAEMVPPSSRGWYFSRRNAVATGVGASVGVIGALILDWFRRNGNEGIGFSTIFALGIVCATASLAMYLRMRDIPRPNPVKQTVREGTRAFGVPFKDANFRKVLLFFALFVAGQSFAGNLFSAFALESLDLPFTIIQGAGFMHAAGNLLSARMWGFLADKYGNKPILTLVGFGLTLTPVMWLFCYPGRDVHNAVVLLSSHLFVGIIWAGVALCQFNLLLATAKPEERSTYIGVGLGIQAIIGGVSPLLGASMLTAMRGFVPADQAYKWVFATSMALRLIAVFFLAPVREEGAIRIRTTLKHLRRTTPGGIRAMRSLTRSSDALSREDAIGRVASKGFALGADEIVKALHDPSPRVRRRAAQALAQLQDESAGEALVHMVVEHPDLVEEETVEALGELRHAEAVPALVNLLQSPRSLVRRAAAKALGRVGDAEAIGPLMAAAAEPGDPDLRRASLQALRVLGAREAQPVVGDALYDPHPSVRIAAAEVVAEMAMRDLAPHLRKSLEYFDDEAASEVAYALGCVGTVEDIPTILHEASQGVSMTTRRRCLLGVARLLGVEPDAYKLMLLEGMARDSALLEALRGAIKSVPAMKVALERYSAGNEPEALAELARRSDNASLHHLAANPVEEAFLVASLVAGR